MNAGKFGLGISICVAVGVFVPAVAQAQSAFRFYLGAAPTTYKMSFDKNAPNFGGSLNYASKTAKSSYTAANLGMTWASSKGIYVDVSAQQSLSATHDLWNSVTTQPQDFSHDSYALTAGYSHAFAQGASISGFGGYLVSHTTLNAPNPPFTFVKDKFDSHGYFVGVGGGIPALGGQVTASGAIAIMNGRWSDDSGTYNNHANYTVGFSLGTAYTYKFTPAWGVTADLRYQNYDYKFALYSATVPAYTISEKIVSAGVRLSYQF